MPNICECSGWKEGATPWMRSQALPRPDSTVQVGDPGATGQGHSETELGLGKGGDQLQAAPVPRQLHSGTLFLETSRSFFLESSPSCFPDRLFCFLGVMQGRIQSLGVSRVTRCGPSGTAHPRPRPGRSRGWRESGGQARGASRRTPLPTAASRCFFTPAWFCLLEMCSFMLAALLRYNWYIVNHTHLQCTIIIFKGSVISPWMCLTEPLTINGREL